MTDNWPAVREHLERLDNRLDDQADQLTKIQAAITGEDPLHPNGLRTKINRNRDGLKAQKDRLSELEKEWGEFKAQIKVVVLIAGALGGTVAAAAGKWVA